jgi:hypothetical protein
MTMRIGPGQAAREHSDSAARGGSVLQALQGLLPDPPRAEEPRATSQRPSPALLPVRPGKASRPETTTGIIDVRALAAARLARGAGPSLASPPFSLARPSPAAAPAAGSKSASLLFLQVRAFLLGALCAGALTGSLIARAASVSSATNAPTADDGDSPAREVAAAGRSTGPRQSSPPTSAQ